MRHAIMRWVPLLVAAVLWAAGAMAQPEAAPGPGGTAAFHQQQASLACADCHADGPPRKATAEASLAAVNRQCIECHGDYPALAAISAPKLANRHINPHASHLVEIGCATCHAGHAAGESFCLACHAFVMPMPGFAPPAKP